MHSQNSALASASARLGLKSNLGSNQTKSNLSTDIVSGHHRPQQSRNQAHTHMCTTRSTRTGAGTLSSTPLALDLLAVSVSRAASGQQYARFDLPQREMCSSESSGSSAFVYRCTGIEGWIGDMRGEERNVGEVEVEVGMGMVIQTMIEVAAYNKCIHVHTYTCTHIVEHAPHDKNGDMILMQDVLHLLTNHFSI
jgi:hypothetical protein